MQLFEKMLELSNQGFACAQIMMILVLEGENKSDPDLIRVLGAFNNGIRDNNQLCGALLGGASIISYFAGQGEPDEVADPDYDEMEHELFQWFKETFTEEYGDITCPGILGGDISNKLSRCPVVVELTYSKVMEILDEHDLL